MDSPLPLPPLDVLSLAREVGVPSQPDEAVEVVAAMDEAWLDWVGKKRSATLGAKRTRKGGGHA